MQESIGKVLDCIYQLDKKRAKASPLEVGTFNIFSVLGVENKEVIICRFLGELLDPNGSHQMGTLPLWCFVNQVLKKPFFTEEDAQKVYVRLEERICNDRRVDIVLHCGNTVFPLEVKIWTKDQDAQLCDYYHYYEERYKLDAIYYLTPTRWSPSKQSKGDLDDGKIVCLSFTEDICEWLKHILPSCDNEMVRASINQFIEVIKKMSTTNDQMQMLKEALELRDDGELNQEKVKAALLLLTNKEDLQKEIWRIFIRNNVKCGDGFEFAACEASDLKVDKYSLLRVNRHGKTVAWICVEQNLYMYCKKTKAFTQNHWHGAADGVYRWIHLSPNKRKPYPLRDMYDLQNVDIVIGDILRDIEGVE